MKNHLFSLIILFFIFASQLSAQDKLPANGAVNVNPDTYFQLNFPTTPKLHNEGKIIIYDAADHTVVDELDMSISPGPKNTRTLLPYNNFAYENLPDSLYTVNKPDLDSSHQYQTNYIGGTKLVDAYHFYPVVVEDSVVKIFPHHNKLKYGRSYYIIVEKGVLTTEYGKAFEIKGRQEWLFHTKKHPPEKSLSKITVAADGLGDFTTIQGAIDFIPEHNSFPVEIYIKNGTYNEIIHCRNRQGLSFIGESRSEVIIQYANNGVFNFRKMSPDPNLNDGSHNIRAVMAINNCSDMYISNLTLLSIGEKPAQAEALLVIGEKIIVDNVSIEGSGDALQATGLIYVNNSKIQGYGDNVLGYGAVFFNRCEFVSTFGPHIWVRNSEKGHGNVLLNCVLRTIGDVETDIARAPDNRGITYPFVEVVLIDCKVEGLRPSGWGTVTRNAENVKYWEYNTTDLYTGKPVDISLRNPVSRQLTMEKDADLIALYKTPANILKGWKPIISAK